MTRAELLNALEQQEAPPGMIEYEARTAIRDLIRLVGFEAARDQVAQYLNDEADGKRTRQ